MARRAIFRSNISFGLVSIPAELYSATHLEPPEALHVSLSLPRDIEYRLLRIGTKGDANRTRRRPPIYRHSAAASRDK